LGRVFAAELAAAGLNADALDARLERAVTRVLERREADRFIGQAELARRLGLSSKALSMRLARGSDLLAIARLCDGKRMWLLSEIQALTSKRVPTLRAIDGAGR
jgi:hypothetical protein